MFTSESTVEFSAHGLNESIRVIVIFALSSNRGLEIDIYSVSSGLGLPMLVHGPSRVMPPNTTIP